LTPIRYLRNKEKLHKAAEKTIAEFGRPYSEELCRDMVWKYCRHMTSLKEYFKYGLEGKTPKQIEEFVGSRELRFWVSRFNDPDKRNIFSNKYDTYLTFKKYYKRQVIKADNPEDEEPFKRFVLSHEKVSVKPLNGQSGAGVRWIQACDDGEAYKLFYQLMNDYPKGFVAEEPIEQCKDMKAFHPQSVNTLRITSILHKDGVRIWHPFMRCGMGDAIVDNYCTGGLMILIDPDTGVTQNCIDNLGRPYETHPDTGKTLKGCQIPRWDEALELVRELARVVPKIRYVGWDLALTDTGWVVVEGNSRPSMMQQGVNKEGYKKEFKRELRKK